MTMNSSQSAVGAALDYLSNSSVGTAQCANIWHTTIVAISRRIAAAVGNAMIWRPIFELCLAVGR